MDEQPKQKNGRVLRPDDPLLAAIKEKIAYHKSRGEAYPRRQVEHLVDVPFVRYGMIPYHAETLERIMTPRNTAMTPVTLPEDFIITGKERLPYEARDQYRKYLVYRDLGPERTLNQAAKAWGAKAHPSPHGGTSATSSTITRLASRWRWVERVQAFDAGIETEARLTLVQRERKQIEEHIERRATYLENEHQVIVRGIKRVTEMQAFPVDEQTVVTEYYDDGRPKTITIIAPVKWNQASLSQYIGELTKLARLHFGMATSNASAKIETTITDATNRQDRDIPEAERAAHEYAAREAEERYFQALDEFKSRQEPERVVAQITEAADG